ncbi:hypothetical protein EIP91_001282 [Steccherinum ochraceum]|uniref:Ubiquitin carboxyl-terminal hydrolase n=1 Tax=Steccherinum ochraceum TaxID=92696 RepID=A0A4R0RGS3_9APHY|nr:hypothetical protein EIP91_001282 [Steccherinum ochraceum]
MMKRWVLPFGTVQTGSQSTTTPQLESPPPVITPADAKMFGFENFGNTCYANSVLQALYFCGPFRELVIQYPDPAGPELSSIPPPPIQPSPVTIPTSPRPKPSRKMSVSDSPHVASPPPPSATIPGSIPIPPTPPTLLSALRSLYVHISKSPADRGTVSPKAFVEKLKQMNKEFQGAQHQDAHEFLNYLLNTIVEEMEADRRNGAGEDLTQSIATLSSNGPTANGSASATPPLVGTLVHRLFEGTLTSETRCLTCETVSSRDESFLDLSIDIEQNSSVTACLRQFSASEMLCQKNKFFCDSCCDLQEAEKRMKIKKLPNILALHLKRFKYQEDTGRYIKLTYRVAFPYHLRLFNTVDDAEDPDRLYELFAIVVHIGAGPHHGHYVSIIKTRDTWLLFDDDTVEVMKEADIPKYFGDSGTNNGSAYVLYYQAVDLDVTALGVKLLQPPAPTTVVNGAGSVSTSSTRIKAELLPPDVLKSPLQVSDPDHVAPSTPPGLGTETPPDNRPITFTAPSYTSSTASTPGASTTVLAPLIIPNGHSSSSSSGSGSGAGLGVGLTEEPESITNTPTGTTSTSAIPGNGAGATTLGSIMGTIRSGSASIRSKSGSRKEKEKDETPVPPVPPMPASPIASTSSSSAATSAGTIAEHGNSVNVSRAKSGKLPPRPSTAGAELGSGGRSRPKSAIQPPLPPLPGSPALSGTGKMTNGGGQSVPSTPITAATNMNGHALPSPSLSPPQRPSRHPRPHSSAGPSPPSSFGQAMAAPTPPPPVTPTVKKRASRKLSFTAPLLGFGRSRDKDKDKDR